MALEIPRSRLNIRAIQQHKRNVPIQEIIAVEGQNPMATGIETAGNVIGQALTKRAELRRQGEMLAQQRQESRDILALEHKNALELAGAKKSDAPGTPESYTVVGTDKNGNVIQVGNKSGTPRVIPLPGGGPLYPKNDPTLTPENAGKLTMLQSAIKDLDDAEGMIFDKDGTPNYSMIAASNVPFGGLPFSKGRDLNSMIENSIAAKLRAETGATANESEVKSIANRFKPTIRDNGETIRGKLSRLRGFMTTAVSAADPRGFRRSSMNGLQPIPVRQPTSITPAKVGRFHIEEE